MWEGMIEEELKWLCEDERCKEDKSRSVSAPISQNTSPMPPPKNWEISTE